MQTIIQAAIAFLTLLIIGAFAYEKYSLAISTIASADAGIALTMMLNYYFAQNQSKLLPKRRDGALSFLVALATLSLVLFTVVLVVCGHFNVEKSSNLHQRREWNNFGFFAIPK